MPTAAELYQAEKAKRTSVGVKAVLAPMLSLVQRAARQTHLACPKCASEHIALYVKRGVRNQRRYGTRQAQVSRSATCGECGHCWRTRSKEAFAETRLVELRG